jgi:hypothetical protein
VTDLKAAVYAAITRDDIIMARLGGQPPYPGRLHETAVVDRSTAAIVIDGQTTVGISGREDVTITMRVMSRSHDLAEAVFGDLRRLFGSAGRTQWTPLDVGGAKALARIESASDLPEPDSDVHVKVVVLRLKVARPA